MGARAGGLFGGGSFRIVGILMDTQTLMNTERACALPRIARAIACAALGSTLVMGSVPAIACAEEAPSALDSSSAELLAIPGTAEEYVSVALSQPDGEPEGGDYNKYNFYSGLPWCGHFAVWCAREAGVSSDVIPDIYNCEAMVAWYQQRGQYHDATYIPEPGDLIFYTYGWGITHVGIVTGVDGSYVYTKEGNTNHSWCGQVGSFARPIGVADTGGWGYIAGYASPAFPDAPETHIFSDTPKSSWYVQDGYLDYVVETGLMSGYADNSGEFGPNDVVTRGQVVTILYRAATGATDAGTNNDVDTPFSDVSRGSYAAAASVWAYENGISTGYLDETGQPTGVLGIDDPVTREQLAAMVARTAQACGVSVAVDVNAAFSSVQGADELSDFAVEPMAWCIASGIITGDTSYSPAAILPHNTASRCQMTKIVTVLDRDVL